MDHQQGPEWGRDDVDRGLGGTARAGALRTAHVLTTTRLSDECRDVTVTVLQAGATLVIGGFETDVHARVWAHAVAQVAVDDIASREETHAPPTEADLAVHREVTQSQDLADVIRRIWTRIGTADVMLRPEGDEYALLMTRGGTYRHAGQLTMNRAEDVRTAVLALSNAQPGSTDAAFDAEGYAVRVSMVKIGAGLGVTLRPIPVARH